MGLLWMLIGRIWDIRENDERKGRWVCRFTKFRRENLVCVRRERDDVRLQLLNLVLYIFTRVDIYMRRSCCCGRWGGDGGVARQGKIQGQTICGGGMMAFRWVM